MEQMIKFRRKLFKVGENGKSTGITLPPELVEYINVSQGEDVVLGADTNKRGEKYLFIYKEVTQDDNTDTTPQ